AATIGGSVTVVAGATVSGSGAIDGWLTSAGGVVSPGASAGRMTVGGFDLQTGCTLQLELNGATAGSGYDQIFLPEDGFEGVMLGGALQATLVFIPTQCDIFLVILNGGTGSLTGTFSNAPT